jgi:DNA-binding NtrC family response regulator
MSGYPAMNPAVALKGMLEGRFARRPEMGPRQEPGRPTILVATLDVEIRNGLTQLLPQFPVNTVWVKSVEDARSVLASSQVAACFCDIWLQGGTCRELIRYIRRISVDLPVIIVSAPNCPTEYRDGLAALNLEGLYFLDHPYRLTGLEFFIELANVAHWRQTQQRSTIYTPEMRHVHAH